MSKIAASEIMKVDTALGLVFGFAIVCTKGGVDYYDQNIDKGSGRRVPEHITEEAMLKGAAEFAETARVGNEMHEGEDTGTYVFLFPLTTEIAKALDITTDKTGLLVAYKPTAEVLKKFEDGTYTGFSMEGSRVAFVEEDR